MTCCWHLSEFQHAMLGHQDVSCCWCGTATCLTLERRPLDGHGPKAPTAWWRPEPPACAERPKETR